ncbi:replication initiator protein A [Sagittula salina]|uniref:Replication initiator protein A n=1 Tax=Sagittula salina TaxID=2820268 RepID=A0A940S1S9_9RHOB|nr:replication initiator protein A [Sagittula salina]MBP0484488.1 replication initiator protein A [Sagittula salina]
MTSATAGGTFPHSGSPPSPSGSDFFLCDFFDASPKGDLASMEHPIFSLSTKPDTRVLSYEHNGAEITVTPSVRGRATIHDKDILIYCVSQLMAAVNAGRAITRRLTLTAHDLLVATNRDTSGDAYARLKEAFERLAGTRITTNIETGGTETTRGFGLIEAWEIVRRSPAGKRGGGRMLSVSVTLSDWLFRAVEARSVLTLSRDYFRLRKPLERRVYELARKHCGRQAGWRISVAVLHKKAGSAAPVRVFRAAMRKMIAEGNLPDYEMSEEPGDMIRFARKGGVVEDGPDLPPLGAEVMAEARRRAPGADVYALEAEWRAWWAASGRVPLKSPAKAFLGWIDKRKG